MDKLRSNISGVYLSATVVEGDCYACSDKKCLKIQLRSKIAGTFVKILMKIPLFFLFDQNKTAFFHCSNQ